MQSRNTYLIIAYPASRIPGIAHPASLIPEGDMDMDMAMTVVTLQLSATERHHHRQEWVVRLRM